MPPSVDRDQLAALRRLQTAFGDVQVLAVQRRQAEEEAGQPLPSPACQQLALPIQRRQRPGAGGMTHRRAGRLPDPPFTE